MRSKNKILSLMIFTALLLAGCTTAKHNHNNASQPSHSLSGRVADGYINGATVCLDTNQNGTCSLNKPHTITVQNGKFHFTHLTNKQISAPLIAQITKKSIDADTKTIIKIPYIMLAPRKSTFISPLTTLIEYKIQLGDSLISAMVNISKKTGVPLLYVDGNFMKSDSLVAKKARFAAKIIVKTMQLVISKLAIKHITPNASLDINTTRYISQKILDHAIIIKKFLSSVSKQNIKTVQTGMDVAIKQLSQAIIMNLSDYNREVKTINKEIQTTNKQDMLSKQYNHATKTVHAKSDAENIGAIIFVLTLQLFFFVFLAFFL